MLDAAIRCFTTAGYGGTTMATIAAEPGVAVQTLYFTFHTKSELLQQTFDRAVLGDVPVPPHETDWYRSMEAERKLRPALHHLVSGVTAILERFAPLRSVFDEARADEVVHEVWQRGEQLRLEGYRQIVEILAKKRPLRVEYDVEGATDVLFVLLGPDTFRAFIEGRRWSIERWQTWVVATIGRELFGSLR
jgi:AcrR family transcriptional regulator